jgi:hypothetical protein
MAVFWHVVRLRACWSGGMRVPYRGVTDLAAAVAWLRELEARTVVFDVEPFVAHWDSGATELRDGVDGVFTLLGTVPGLEVVGFATNSLRRHEGMLGGGEVRAFYIATARKPLLTRPYRDLPRPAVLVGDQVATDGVLAWRLGYAFAHARHGQTLPWGPRAMRLLGRPLLRLIFDPA